MNGTAEQTCPERFQISWLCPIVKWRAEKQRDATTAPLSRRSSTCGKDQPRHPSFVNSVWQTSVYKGYKQDKIEMRGDRAEMSDFPLYLNTVAGGLDCRDQTIGGFSFVVKIYAVPVVEIIG